MSHLRPRRRSAALAVGAAALVPLFVLPGGALAAVTSTAIDTPAPDALQTFTTIDTDDYTVAVHGTSTGGAPDDEVDVVCTLRVSDSRIGFPVAKGVPIQADGQFVATVKLPAIPCRLHAMPAGTSADAQPAPDGDVDLAAFSGPRVLPGAFVSVTDDLVPSADSYLSQRPQRRGLGLISGLLRAATYDGGGLESFGGLDRANYLEDTSLRAVLDVGGALLPVTGPEAADPSTSQLVVDGAAARVAAELGGDHVHVVSHQVDPVSGDLDVVETAPVALVRTEADGSTSAVPSGIQLRRTIRQDHDGRVFTFHDEFRSADGAAHRVQARYRQVAGYNGRAASIAYRAPWATGDAYVAPDGTVPFGPSPAGTTPATVFVRVAPTQVDDEDVPGTGGEVAFAYDTPLSDARVVDADDDALVTQVDRAVPAGGSATVSQRVVQAITRTELDELLRTSAPTSPPVVDPPVGDPPVSVDPGPPTGTPTNPPTGAGPVPLGDVSGLPSVPLSPAVDPLARLQAAARKALTTRKQAVRLRTRKTVTVTVKGVPAGRYGVTVRRGSRRGTSVAGATTTLRNGGTVKLQLRLTAAGRRWFATRAGRGRSLKAFVAVSWTPAGAAAPRTRSSRYAVRVR